MDVQEQTVEVVLAFSRFYTARFGLLEGRQDDGDRTPTERRVLCELGYRRGLTAGQLGRELRLDAGHISRILRRLVERGEVIRRTSDADGRVNALGLTARGRAAFEALQRSAQAEVAAMMQALPSAEQAAVAAAMRRIRRAFEGAAAEPRLRPLGPGDLGWIVHRHGVLYAEEFGLDASFEALVAEIGAGFVKRHDPEREAAWVAEVDGEVVGSVFLVAKDRETAQLRLLYLEPAVRGQGLGRRLVETAVGFAREAGYARVVLWTQAELAAARRADARAGFVKVAEEPETLFGRQVVAETWELALS
jgi:DNA-binding MarR family transcriptional regulator/N-acetylglutamate synthase-like GNAT family acetyltransferase